MKKFSNFNGVMGLLLLIVMLWTIVPVFADDGNGSVGGVPIVFGTEAGGGSVAQVVEPVSTEDSILPDGFFIRYDFGFIIVVAIVVVGVLLYRSTPPSAQKLYAPALDITLNLLKYLISLPGTKFDKPLQVMVDSAEELQKRLQSLPPTSPPPPVADDKTPYIPPYSGG